MTDETFRIRMEATNPERKHFRSYVIEANPDLFGRWVIEVRYGKIGTRGRTTTYSSEDVQDAKQIVRQCLKRRASAPKRLGVPYRVQELHDPAQWTAISLS